MTCYFSQYTFLKTCSMVQMELLCFVVWVWIDYGLHLTNVDTSTYHGFHLTHMTYYVIQLAWCALGLVCI